MYAASAIRTEIGPSGLGISAGLHLLLLGLMIFGMPYFFEPQRMSTAIPVEVVQLENAEQLEEAIVSEITETPPETQVEAVEPEPEPEPVEPEPVDAQVAQAAPAAPAPPPPPSLVEPVEAVAPRPLEPAPQAAPARAVEPEPQPVPVEPPPPDPLVETTPETQPEDQSSVQVETPPAPPQPRPEPPTQALQEVAEEAESQPQEDILSSVLRNVQKDLKARAPQPQSAPQQANAQPPQQQLSSIDEFKVRKVGLMIREQVSRCWRVDAGAREAQDLVVSIRIFLAPDGRLVTQPQFMDVTRYRSDAFYRSAADNARRAVLECQPFQLPREDYDLWKDLVLNFNPAEMFGG